MFPGRLGSAVHGDAELLPELSLEPIDRLLVIRSGRERQVTIRHSPQLQVAPLANDEGAHFDSGWSRAGEYPADYFAKCRREFFNLFGLGRWGGRFVMHKDGLPVEVSYGFGVVPSG
jgi:hypothetical protein